MKLWNKGIKEKRTSKRIPTHFLVNFFNGDSFHYGLVTNLSEKGIYFIAGADLSSELNIEVSIPLKEEMLKVPVKINRTERTGYLYDGFGAELSNSSQDYIEFLRNKNAQFGHLMI
jgi:hypothetical protein